MGQNKNGTEKEVPNRISGKAISCDKRIVICRHRFRQKPPPVPIGPGGGVGGVKKAIYTETG